jgi:CRP/FNR family cyclic AMP-dependent transcriptional regulator
MKTNSLEIITQEFPQFSYTPKSIIMDPAKTIPDVYYLEEGYVRMYLLSEEGEELTLHIFRPGACFPLMLVVADVINKYYFEAITPTIVRKIPKSVVVTAIKEDPKLAFEIAQRFAGGVVGYLAKVESLLLHDAYSRVVSILCYLGERFSKKVSSDTVKVNLAITHYLLSTWVGLTRETVSRQIEKLERNKLIESKDNVLTIFSLSALKAELDK